LIGHGSSVAITGCGRCTVPNTTSRRVQGRDLTTNLNNDAGGFGAASGVGALKCAKNGRGGAGAGGNSITFPTKIFGSSSLLMLYAADFLAE